MIAFNRKQIKKYKYTLYTVSILNSQYNFVFFFTLAESFVGRCFCFEVHQICL